MAGFGEGRQIKILALFTYGYIAFVVILWALGIFGSIELTPLSFLIVIPPLLAVTYIWWTSSRMYSHEEPAVERLRKTLQVEKLQSEGIISAIDDAVCIINHEGVVKHVNARFLELVASREDELLNHHYTHPMVVNKRVRVLETSANTPHLSVNVAKVFETKMPVIVERQTIEHVDSGKRYELRISLLPLTNEDGVVSALMIIGRDISDLIHIQELKDQFIANASHELRTPATAIGGYLDLIVATEYVNLNDKQKSYITDAKGSTERMIDLINDMIDMSSLETGKYGNLPQQVQVEQAVQQTLIDMSKKHDDKFIKTSVDIAVPTILVDPQRLHLVLRQLVDNAYKFTPDKGVVTVRVIPENTTTVVEITDNGESIPEEKQSDIFDKFTKLDDTGAKSGTGMGLAICKKVVDDWGGEIRVANQEGGGVVFTFTIPNSISAPVTPAPVVEAPRAEPVAAQ